MNEKKEKNKVIIKAGSPLPVNFLREIWDYRELLYFLVLRDIKVRYKQTFVGAGWAILQPFMTMVVFSIFFGKLARVPSDGIPYPLFAYTALLPWQLFAFSLSEAGNSLVNNRSLITKVYFPRMLIVLTPILAGLVDFLIAFVLLLGMMLYYGVKPGLTILTLPLFILMAVITALAVGIWLAVLNVQYRDVRYTIPFLTQFWMFITPIAYPSSLVPEKWRVLYGLNPMSSVVEGFRWALLGSSVNISSLLGASVIVVLLILAGGLVYFRKLECQVADLV